MISRFEPNPLSTPVDRDKRRLGKSTKPRFSLQDNLRYHSPRAYRSSQATHDGYMGEVIDMHGQPAQLEDDLEFISDLARYAENFLANQT